MTSENSMVVFDELTTGDRLRVFWGFIWRGFLITIASALGGAIVGLAMMWQYIRWLFRAKWSGYQLRLVRQDA